MLKNPRYAGLGVWNRRGYGKHHMLLGGKAVKRTARQKYWIEHEEAQWVIAGPTHEPADPPGNLSAGPATLRRPSRPTRKQQYRFSGLVFCGRCGYRMKGHYVPRQGEQESVPFRHENLTSDHRCPGAVLSERKLIDGVGLLLQETLLHPGNREGIREYVRQMVRQKSREEDDSRKADRKELQTVRRRIANLKERFSLVSDRLAAELAKDLDGLLERESRTGGATAEAARGRTSKEVAEASNGVFDLFFKLREVLAGGPGKDPPGPRQDR